MDRKTRIMIAIVIILAITQFYLNYVNKKALEKNFVSNVYSPYVGCRIAFDTLQRAISLSRDYDEDFDYKDVNSFTESILHAFSLKDVKYLEASSVYPYRKVSDKDLRTYSLYPYRDKPILILLNKMAVMFYKFESGCRNVDTENIENSSCVVDVDINMYNSLPNNKVYDNRYPGKTDRYSFILDGRRDMVVIPKMYDKKLFYRQHKK